MTSAPVEHLDPATVIKVLQAVSGEIVQEKLIGTLMRTAMEHSGADRGLLILVEDAGPRVVAEAFIRDTLEVGLRDESVNAQLLPEFVFHRVARTQAEAI